MIVYTIGSTKSYQQAFEKEPFVYKIGRSNNYLGGWIWKSYEEAQQFINSDNFNNINWGDDLSRKPENFSVYGVTINNWEIDIYYSDEDHLYHLIDDALLHQLL